ncbi:MAG: hypothetical protein HS105_04785 [Chloracidobacterium sp.]|nr:hypothetical protein [Chloracidobacterium sp.]MCC6826349.1 hypothetical protein [Acidobacteriota bacterium]MCO5333095.1 hypothetical protein [Pyrinomonadaceae bacterium]
MKQITIAAFIFLLAGLASAQVRSIYTSTSEKACKERDAGDSDGGEYIGTCPGVSGYKLELIEGDLRQTLNVITPAKKTLRLRLNEFFSAFSAIGEKIEWRVRRGVPFALIARFNVAGDVDDTKRISYLMVAKVGPKESCITDIVKPAAKQNETARKLADEAPSKPCKAVGTED